MLHVAELFEEKGTEVYCVELVDSKEVQVYRNEIENRLENKASRRDLEFARKNWLTLTENIVLRVERVKFLLKITRK